MRALFVTMLGACLAFSAAPARAESPADAAAAQAWFERGREAARRGELDAACRAFAESQRLDPGAGTLLNWAHCEARRGRVVSAWQHLNEASALLEPSDDRAPFVRAQMRSLVPRLARLRVRLAPNAASGAHVLQGGTELGTAQLGLVVLTDPGELELVVTCHGHAPARSVVTLHEGEQLEVTLETGPLLATATTPTPAPPSTLQRDLGVSFVTFGALAAGLGLASGIVVAERQATADAACPAQRCSPAGMRAAESGQRWLVVNSVAWGVGAAALLTGGTLLLTAPSQSRQLALTPRADGVSFSYVEHY